METKKTEKPEKPEIPQATFKRVLIDAPGGWTEGYQIISPEGKELFPYFRKSDAKLFCKQEGWAFKIAE